MTRGHLALILGAALCCGGAPAAAEEGSPNRFAVDAILENLEEGGSRLRLEGQAPNLPDGTYLHCSVTIARGPMDPVEAAFFRIPVKDKTFEGSFPWPEHQLAPATYGVKLELFVDEQGPNIKRWLGRELGYGPEDRVEMAVEQVHVGSAAERREARLEHLRQAREFAVRAEGLRYASAEATASTPGDDPAWADVQTDLFGRMRKLQEDITAFRAPWVVLEEDWILGRIERALDGLVRVVQAHARLPDGAHQHVQGLQRVLQKIVADIDSVLPASERQRKGEEEGDADDEGEAERPREEGK